MTHYSSKDVGVLSIGGYRLLGYSTTFGWSVEAITEEAYTLGDEWVYNDAVGIKRASATQNGFFDTATLASHEAIKALFGTRVSGVVGVQGATALDPVECFAGMFTGSDNWNIPRDEFAKLDVGYVTTGEVESGKLLLPYTAITSTGDDGGQDSGDSSTNNGGVGYLQVNDLAFDTATGLTVTIGTASSLGGPYTDLITFTQITDDTSGVADERVEVTGVSADQYIQVDWEWAGTVGSETADILVAFVRNPST